MNRYVLAPFLLLALYLPVGQASATIRSEVRVSSTLHGIRLTLLLPRRRYAINALIWVTVRMTNLTRGNVPIPQLSNTGWPCSPTTVQVYDDHDLVVYPPAVRIKPRDPSPLNPPCPAPTASSPELRPGERATGSDLVILRAPNLQATVYEGRNRITTPTVRLSLTPSRPLQISVVHNSAGVRAVVPTVQRRSGHVFINSLWQCNEGGLIRVSSGGWSEQSSSGIRAGCTTPAIWYAVVGYVNQPVGVIKYVQRRR